MRILVALGLVASMAMFSQAAPKCHLSEIRTCIYTFIEYMHSLPKRSIPETEDDVNTMCSAIKNEWDCYFGFIDNCTTPLQKEMINLLIEGFLTMEKGLCTPGSDIRAKYLAHSPCLNKVSQMDVVKEQMEYMLAVLEKAQSVDRTQFIPYACCGYSKIMNTFVKLGQDNCGQEAVDTLQELTSMAIAQLPEILCNGFDGEEDRCQALLPADGAKPSNDVKEMEIYKFIHNMFRNWLD